MMTIESGTGLVMRSFPGQVRAIDQSEMSFEVAGVLVELPVKEGQAVTKGQMLARLDDRDYKSAVLAATAKRNEAKLQFERAATLVKAQAISQAEYDTKKAFYDVAQAEFDKASKAVADTIMRAPFDGQVSSLLVDNHKAVQAKQVIMNVKDLKRLDVVVYVSERALLSAQTGTTTRMVAVFEDLPGKEFPVTIREFATDPDPATKTYAVKLTLQNPDPRILPGMTAAVRLEGRRAGGAMLVPAGAVVNDGSGAPYVWVVDPAMKVVRRTVGVGALSGDEIAIESGLASGETIAVSGAHFLREGMQVCALPKYE
jgi:RND family efflux transporter MFP subunit